MPDDFKPFLHKSHVINKYVSGEYVAYPLHVDKFLVASADLKELLKFISLKSDEDKSRQKQTVEQYRGFAISKTSGGNFEFGNGMLLPSLDGAKEWIDYLFYSGGKPNVGGIYRHETDEYKEAWNQAVKTEEKIREEMETKSEESILTEEFDSAMQRIRLHALRSVTEFATAISKAIESSTPEAKP